MWPKRFNLFVAFNQWNEVKFYVCETKIWTFKDKMKIKLTCIDVQKIMKIREIFCSKVFLLQKIKFQNECQAFSKHRCISWMKNAPTQRKLEKSINFFHILPCSWLLPPMATLSHPASNGKKYLNKNCMSYDIVKYLQIGSSINMWSEKLRGFILGQKKNALNTF